MSERAQALEAALRALRNECHAIKALSYDEIKASAGYTNLKCWTNRMDEADAILAAAAPPVGVSLNHEDAAELYVPGNWRCLRCGFVLTRATLFAASGTVGSSIDDITRMTGEACPNDGTAMVRVTWRDRAIENQEWAERLINDVLAAAQAESLPAALARIKELAAPVGVSPQPDDWLKEAATWVLNTAAYPDECRAGEAQEALTALQTALEKSASLSPVEPTPTSEQE